MPRPAANRERVVEVLRALDHPVTVTELTEKVGGMSSQHVRKIVKDQLADKVKVVGKSPTGAELLEWNESPQLPTPHSPSSSSSSSSPRGRARAHLDSSGGVIASGVPIEVARNAVLLLGESLLVTGVETTDHQAELFLRRPDGQEMTVTIDLTALA